MPLKMPIAAAFIISMWATLITNTAYYRHHDIHARHWLLLSSRHFLTYYFVPASALRHYRGMNYRPGAAPMRRYAKKLPRRRARALTHDTEAALMMKEPPFSTARRSPLYYFALLSSLDAS